MGFVEGLLGKVNICFRNTHNSLSTEHKQKGNTLEKERFLLCDYIICFDSLELAAADADKNNIL